MTTSRVTNDSSPTTEKILDHNYDGIQEYDNPPPTWWKWLFWGCIAFSPLYLMFFHNGAPGRSVLEQYEAASSANTKKQYQEIGELTPDEATFVKYLAEPKWIGVGEAIFKSNCVSCHGADGSGGVGPNMRDESFKHIKNLNDVYKVIHDGVAGGAMPAWASRLQHPNDLVLVTVYVASIRGTMPAGQGKAPDGSPIPPWPKQ